MKKVLTSGASILFYLVTPALLFYWALSTPREILLLNLHQIIPVLAYGTVFIYLGSLFLALFVFKEKREKIMRITFFYIFVVYCLFLLQLTIFRMELVNSIECFSFISTSTYFEVLSKSINIIPFASIVEFLGKGNTRKMIVNIFGNLVAFMPFALFLPLLFKKCRKFGGFILTFLIINVSVEILQLFLMVGSADIDDVILNTSGAVLIYLLFHIKPIRLFINKATMLKY